MKKKIGIIGGMGPSASAHFYTLLIKYAQELYGVCDNDAFPEMYLVSLPVPDFIQSERYKDQAERMLIDRIEKMNTMGITMYCMACNTGHLLLESLKRHTDVPFVSLLDVIPEYVVSQKIHTIGILGTPTTVKTKLVTERLELSGVRVIEPEHGEIQQLGEIIRETIAGKNFESNSKTVQLIVQGMLRKGAEAILESCTELPLIMPKQHMVRVIDTMDILAREVLAQYYKEEI